MRDCGVGVDMQDAGATCCIVAQHAIRGWHVGNCNTINLHGAVDRPDGIQWRAITDCCIVRIGMLCEACALSGWVLVHCSCNTTVCCVLEDN